MTSYAHAATVRGHPLVFTDPVPEHGGGRVLLGAEEEDTTLWYVKSGSMPPPGCVAKEAVAPGVYLARGEASNSYPRGKWTPEMKYNASMRTSAPPRYPDFGVLVRTDDDFFEVEGCITKRTNPGRFYVSCSKNELQKLANDHRVLWISEIPKLQRHSYEARRLMMGTSSLLDGTGTRVAVSDSGLDANHCAFYEGSSPPLGSVNSARRKVVGIIKGDFGDYLANEGAHGTATLGEAVGWPCGVYDETGVAPGAKAWFLDISADANEQWVYPPDNLAALISNSGASVHSASWGVSNDGEYDDMNSERDSMAHDDPKICQVQSAGNDGPYERTGAACKNGLTVAACLSRKEAYVDTMSSAQIAAQPELYDYTSQAWFSSRGPAQDGRLVPQVCAPGVSVRVPKALAPPATLNHSDYFRLDGTSFSAPAIAGMVANLQQKWKDAHAGVLPTCALIEATLMAHAQKATRVVSRSNSRLNVLSSAPDIVTLGTPILDFDHWTDVDGYSVTSTGRRAFCFENNGSDSTPWTIVVRWTDVPAVAGANPALINDLDIVVVGATGTVQVADDALNNFEIVKDWVPQHTRIIVSAFQGVSTFGAQPFAIHIRGKTNLVSCASTLLPSEYSGCTHGSTSVDSWLGTSSCDFQVCPSGTCGADCARTCDLARPCNPTNGGEGAYDDGDVCRPTVCTDNLFVADDGCRCKMGTAKACAGGSMAQCTSEGTFAACVSESNNDNPGIQSAAAPPSGMSFFVVLVVLLLITTTHLWTT